MNEKKIRAVCEKAVETGNIPDEAKGYSFYYDLLSILNMKDADIKSLKNIFKKLFSLADNMMNERDAEIAERKTVCKTMFNRCITTNGTTMCGMCAYRKMCEQERTMMPYDTERDS